MIRTRTHARRRRGALLVALAAAALFVLPARQSRAQSAGETLTYFTWVDIYVVTDDEPLAAYQVELTATRGGVAVVGVEGGEDPAFAEPPYYDPAALQNERVILAAYSFEDVLPAGATRVARVHLMITGDEPPTYELNLDAAAGADGELIVAAAYFEEGE